MLGFYPVASAPISGNLFFLPDVTDTHDGGHVDQHYLDWWRKKHEPRKRKHTLPEEVVRTPEAEPEIPIPAFQTAPVENDDDDALALLMLME